MNVMSSEKRRQPRVVKSKVKRAKSCQVPGNSRQERPRVANFQDIVDKSGQERPRVAKFQDIVDKSGQVPGHCGQERPSARA